jgi:hypothetical protein
MACEGCGEELPEGLSPCPYCGALPGLALDGEVARALDAMRLADSAQHQRARERHLQKVGGAMVMFIPYVRPGMRPVLPTLPEPMDVQDVHRAMVQSADSTKLVPPAEVRLVETDRPSTIEDYAAVARLLREYGAPPTPVPLEDPVLRAFMMQERAREDDGRCQVCGEPALRVVLFAGEPWLRVCRFHAQTMGDQAP